MKSLLRRWLGYDEVALHLIRLQEEIILLRSDIAATFFDEHDPKRKEMSNKLGLRMIEKLKGEDIARWHTLGEL